MGRNGKNIGKGKVSVHKAPDVWYFVVYLTSILLHSYTHRTRWEMIPYVW
jgi:hypothetical protein